MAKKRDNRFNIKRCWLNTANSDSTGYIISGLSKEGSYTYARLKIADCSKIISLDIDVDDSKQRKQAIKKIGIIQNALTNLVKQINLLEKES